MANQKQCKRCSEIKSSEQFGKSKINKDGLQSWCSKCRGLHSNQRQHKSNKNGIIYTITNPMGEVYIGSTKMLPKYRWMRHKATAKKALGSYPLLHKSFQKYGIDNHNFEVIKDCGMIDKYKLREIESQTIISFKSKNTNSLNVNN